MLSIATELVIPIGDIQLRGDLFIPEQARSIIIFSHGSGSSRFSPRNSFISEAINRYGIATLLIDLLTEDEAALYENCFDIQLLANRLISVTEFIHNLEETANLSIGYLGQAQGRHPLLKLLESWINWLAQLYLEAVVPIWHFLIYHLFMLQLC